MLNIKKLNENKRNIKNKIRELYGCKNKYEFIQKYKGLFSNSLVTSNVLNSYGYPFQFNDGNNIFVVNDNLNGSIIVSKNLLNPPYHITIQCVEYNLGGIDMYIFIGLHKGNLSDLYIDSNGKLNPVNSVAYGFSISNSNQTNNLSRLTNIITEDDRILGVGSIVDYRLSFKRNSESTTGLYQEYTMSLTNSVLPNYSQIVNWNSYNGFASGEYVYIIIKPKNPGSNRINQYARFSFVPNN
jgi:hypothetical protein